MTSLLTANFNDALPVSKIGRRNIEWQADPPGTAIRDISACVLNLGDVDARTGTSELIGRTSQGKLVTLDNASPISVTIGPVGSISTYGVNNGGTGYAVNDTFNVNGAGSGANGKILAVAAGVATVVQVLVPGLGYSVATSVATTTTSGGGSGLTIDIFSVENDVFDGLMFFIENIGAGSAVLTPGEGDINGAPNLLLASGAGTIIFWNAAASMWKSLTVTAGGGGGGSTGIMQVVVVEVALTPGAPGNFTIAHGLPSAPAFALIQMDSGGDIWFQTSRYDATNLYLAASDAGLVGKAQCWFLAASLEIPFTSSIGNFSVAHTLGVTPGLVQIQKTAAGGVSFQTPAADATNIYLVGSDAGITGFLEVWKLLPVPVVSNYARVALAPVAPGNFSVAHGLGVVPFLAEIRMTSNGAIWFQTARYDGTNLLLVASDAGVTGYADVWASAAGSPFSDPVTVPHGGTGLTTLTAHAVLLGEGTASPGSASPGTAGGVLTSNGASADPSFQAPAVKALHVVALAPGSPGNFTVTHGAGAVPVAVILEMTSGGSIWFQTPTSYDGTNLYLVASDGGLTANAKVLT